MKRILIIQTASIGDVILSTALLETLHHEFPGAMLDMLVKKGNGDLFAGHPFLHRLIIWDKRNEKYSGVFRIIREARERRYDMVVNLQRFFTTGLITILSGAAETRGFSKNPLSFFFSRRFDHTIGNNTHEVSRNRQLINDLATTVLSNPRLYPSIGDEAAVSQYAAGTYYTISPASLWFTKQYPVEKWLEFIEVIPGGCNIFLLGAGSDRNFCDEIIHRSGHTGLKSLAGKLTLLQSAALMKKAKMNYTNDSAPMHLASAVNAPTTAVFCSTIPEFGFGPLASDSSVIEVPVQLPCRPCGLHGRASCPLEHFHCANKIGVEQLRNRL